MFIIYNHAKVIFKVNFNIIINIIKTLLLTK